MSHSEQPPVQSRVVQKAWHGIIVSVVHVDLLSRATGSSRSADEVASARYAPVTPLWH